MIEEQIIRKIEDCLKNDKKISFLVGAGISAESGIPTFRGKDGYWVSGSQNYKAQEIATKRFFNIASHEVLKFYLYRKSITAFAEPNQSHYMLKEIEDLLGDSFALISQNIDGLHKKAGSSHNRTYLIHGDHGFVRCGDDCSRDLYPFPKGIELKNREKDQLSDKEIEKLKCPKCGEDLRPHVLWFDECYDEEYFKLDTVLKISNETGLLFVIGTSGATSLPGEVVDNVILNKGTVVEVNLHETEFTDWLKDYDEGYVINSGSGKYLTDLKEEIKRVVTKAKKA